MILQAGCGKTEALNRILEGRFPLAGVKTEENRAFSRKRRFCPSQSRGRDGAPFPGKRH